MKRAITLLLVFGLPALCLAQTSANHQLPNDLTVVQATWRYAVNWQGNTAANVLSGNSQTDRVAVAPEKSLEQRRDKGQLGPIDTENDLFLRTGRNTAAVTIRNDGSKTIKAVSYDFFFVNAANGEMWLHYKFRNRETIGAGETRILTNSVTDARAERFRPTGVGSKTSASGKVGYRVVINRIQYADGSEWRNN